ncbi:hypothetical protein NEAUS04_1628, partial [Nematocida ausubeli]
NSDTVNSTLTSESATNQTVASSEGVTDPNSADQDFLNDLSAKKKANCDDIARLRIENARLDKLINNSSKNDTHASKPKINDNVLTMDLNQNNTAYSTGAVKPELSMPKNNLSSSTMNNPI